MDALILMELYLEDVLILSLISLKYLLTILLLVVSVENYLKHPKDMSLLGVTLLALSYVVLLTIFIALMGDYMQRKL